MPRYNYNYNYKTMNKNNMCGFSTSQNKPDSVLIMEDPYNPTSYNTSLLTEYVSRPNNFSKILENYNVRKRDYDVIEYENIQRM